MSTGPLHFIHLETSEEGTQSTVVKLGKRPATEAQNRISLLAFLERQGVKHVKHGISPIAWMSERKVPYKGARGGYRGLRARRELGAPCPRLWVGLPGLPTA
jgi:hypothetical protein